MVGLLGGRPGVFAGTSVGFAIREVPLRLGDEFEQRQLGPREKRRAGAALYWALREVEDRLEEGEEPRSDDFFATDDTERGRADELLDSVRCLDATCPTAQTKAFRYPSQLAVHVEVDLPEQDGARSLNQ